jgi:protein-S-isoprenylcysteine O-methyltransferase Ste14
MYFVGWLIFSFLLLTFTLAKKHPYRFPRLIAFESIISLLFMNAEVWFRDPFSWNQILSWIFLIGSGYLMGHGFYLIKTIGVPAGDFDDPTHLITTGPYRYIRHPLYASLILLSLGIFIKDPGWIDLLLFAATILGAVLTAGIEEGHNLERFGTDYKDYIDRTKRFIPFIY